MKSFYTKCISHITIGLWAVLNFIPNTVNAAQSTDWQMGFQPAATPVMERITEFHNGLLYLIFAISALVLLLLLIIIFRFNAKANPVPSQFSHNMPLELVWTIIPIVIVALICIPSIKMLYFMDKIEEPEMIVKVTGNSWYWNYEYPDYEELAFDSNIIWDDEIDLNKNQIRMLSTDNPLVLPVDTNIEFLITAANVIHSFAVPAFGIKTDAIPGRLNSTWVNIQKPGIYYGQCSELCGKYHAYMPIEVIAIPKDEFEAYINVANEDFTSYHDYKNSAQLAQIQ